MVEKFNFQSDSIFKSAEILIGYVPHYKLDVKN